MATVMVQDITQETSINEYSYFKEELTVDNSNSLSSLVLQPPTLSHPTHSCSAKEILPSLHGGQVNSETDFLKLDLIFL